LKAGPNVQISDNGFGVLTISSVSPLDNGPAPAATQIVELYDAPNDEIR
jgi:hypothetical protein